jgi:hypothetical protein
MLTYTNGVGHLIMSIFMTLIGLALILYPGMSTATQGVGIGLIMAVQAAWFVPGAAKQVASEMVKLLPPIQAVQAAPAQATTQIGSSTPVDMDATVKLPAVKPS